MDTLPEGLEESVITRHLRSGWGLDAAALTYRPVGFGSYHWQLETRGGPSFFLNVDDLGRKPWLGENRDTAFEGLRSAFDTALMLRERAHLGFVVAPIRARDGSAARRLSPQYSLAVFPLHEGRSGQFDDTLSPAGRGQLLRLLGDLHQSTAEAAVHAPQRDLEFPGRPLLEAALGDLGRAWDGGPFAEAARTKLASNAPIVRGWLDTFDRLREEVAASGQEPVITHGEPHAGNLIRAAGGLLLIDWDTVALAPPERDLWMLDDGSPDSFAAYEGRTGRRVHPAAIRMYRLSWDLADVASFLDLFRSAHARNQDTEHAWQALSSYLR